MRRLLGSGTHSSTGGGNHEVDSTPVNVPHRPTNTSRSSNIKTPRGGTSIPWIAGLNSSITSDDKTHVTLLRQYEEATTHLTRANQDEITMPPAAVMSSPRAPPVPKPTHILTQSQSISTTGSYYRERSASPPRVTAHPLSPGTNLSISSGDHADDMTQVTMNEELPLANTLSIAKRTLANTNVGFNATVGGSTSGGGGGGLRFQPYKSTRPDLLQRITHIISMGMVNLEKEEVDRKERKAAEKKAAKMLARMKREKMKLQHDVRQQVESAMMNDGANLQLDPDMAALAQSALHATSPSTLAAEAAVPLDVEGETAAIRTRMLEEATECYAARRYRLYREATLSYINESTLYQAFLRDADDATTTYIDSLLSIISNMDAASAGVSDRELELRRKLSKERTEFMLERNNLTAAISLLEEQCSRESMRASQLEEEARVASEEAVTSKKTLDELRRSVTILTTSLTRLEEEAAAQPALDAARMMEITHLRSSELKMSEEIERLQQVIQGMEQVQASMVTQEAAANLESTIDTLRAEVRRSEAMHSQLLVRYSSLKNVVEDCFRTWQRTADVAVGFVTNPTRRQVDEALAATIAMRRRVQEQQKAAAAAAAAAAKLSAKASVSEDPEDALIAETSQQQAEEAAAKAEALAAEPNDPVDRVITIIETGGTPRVMLETLLDHVMSRRHNQDDADADNANNPNAPSTTYSFDVSSQSPEALALAEEFRSPWSHFDGPGYDEKVPPFLRFHGKIQNMYMSRKDLLVILQEIWDARVLFDQLISRQANSDPALLESIRNDIADMVNTAPLTALSSLNTSNRGTMIVGAGDPEQKLSIAGLSNSTVAVVIAEKSSPEVGLISRSLLEHLPPNPSMSAFVFAYLLHRFGNDQLLATELLYNILDSAKRWNVLSDSKLFLAVFEERLPCAIYADLHDTLERIRADITKEINLQKFAGQFSHEEIGRLTVEQFLRLLRRQLPTKSEVAFSKLSKAILMDSQSGRLIDPVVLLREDRFRGRPHFLEQLCQQHIAEAVAYEKHIMENIDQFIGWPTETEAPLGKYRDALSYADPNKPRLEINRLLSRAVGLPIEDMLLMEARRTVIHIDEFKKRLRSGLLQKSPPNANKTKK